MSEPAKKKKKKTSSAVPEFVAIWVHDEKGQKIVRTMRSTDELQDLMDFYYAMVTAVPRGSGIFLYEGKRVDGKLTPADYEMSSGDVMEFLWKMEPSMYVTLTVQDGEGRKVTRTMRKLEKMQVLMDFYRSMVSCTPNKGVFLYDGEEVMGRKTPADYEMKDQDRIDFRSELKTGNLLTLTVSDSGGRQIARTIRSTDKLQVLFDFYFSAVPTVGRNDASFLYKGQWLRSSQTPMELGWEDGDEIYCFIP